MVNTESADHQEWSKKEEFKRLVLSHLLKMDNSEWDRLRNHSKSNDKMLDEPALEMSRQEVVDASLACAGLSVEDIQSPGSFDCHSIGNIDGHPCFYANGAGYYFWGYPGRGFILEATITYPAYPIGW